ncbi:MAG: TetR/AcrR family transcriptional regulator [Desulfovibrio sp.]
MTVDKTKARVLTAASAVFCEKGYENTTIREICTAAQANVASINYHFGDKRTLYVQVLKQWVDESIDNSILDQFSTDTPPIEKLKAYVKSELKDICLFIDPSGVTLRRVRHLLKEFSADNAEQDIFTKFCEHEELILHPIIDELTGSVSQSTRDEVYIAVGGTLTHFFLRIVEDPDQAIKTPEEHESISETLTTFIAGGLSAVKDKANAK